MKRLRLIQLNERELGSIHYLINPVVSIGRAPTNDIVIKHKQISREHLVIRVAPDGASGTVEDCGSANGAFLNGDPIEKPSKLDDGAILTVGDIDFRVELIDAANIHDTQETTQYETHRTLDVSDYDSEEAESAHRNAELDALGLRNLDQDDALDEIAHVAATIFAAAAGFVSVVGDDTCFYKGAHGLTERQWQRGDTPCLLVLQAHAPVWTSELFANPRLLDLPFLAAEPKFRFYAAAPYCGPTGLVVGTVGAVCEESLSASKPQLQALSNLAKIMERQIHLQLEKKRADQLHLKLMKSSSQDS